MTTPVIGKAWFKPFQSHAPASYPLPACPNWDPKAQREGVAPCKILELLPFCVFYVSPPSCMQKAVREPP